MDMSQAKKESFRWLNLGLDESIIHRVLCELLQSGGDFADLFFESTKRYEFILNDGSMNVANSIMDLGVGLRVTSGDLVGYAYSAEASLPAMLLAARSARAMMRAGRSEVPRSLVRVQSGLDLYPLHLSWTQQAHAPKISIMRRLADLAKQSDPAVQNVTVRLVHSESHILLANSLGQMMEDIRPHASLGISVTALRKGVRQSHSKSLAGRWDLNFYSEERLQQLARETVDETLILFDAVRPQGGEWPVVLAAGASGILLHEAIGHGLEGDLNRKGTSVYAKLMGEQIATPLVTVVDDGTLLHKAGSLNVDDEGTPSQRTVLVEKGRLQSYLHDRLSARHYGVSSTGSGRRDSFRSAPAPRMRCTFMENGPHSRAEIISEVKNGILAENFVNGQVSIGSGNYMFYVKNGWLIENGRLTQPIKDVSVCGSGPTTLQRITMVGDDLKIDEGAWECSKDGQRVPVSIGMPTVLVSKLQVGGSHAG